MVKGCSCATNKTAQYPIQYRIYTMTLWLKGVIQGWIAADRIKELDVLIELPILNMGRNGQMAVTNLMTQMRMISSYEAMLFELEGCKVRLGEVNNQTAKSIFTGTARADKDLMIMHSVWTKRPDVLQREHLADAQAIGICTPPMVPMDTTTLYPQVAMYEDNEIGVGPLWNRKRKFTI